MPQIELYLGHVIIDAYYNIVPGDHRSPSISFAFCNTFFCPRLRSTSVSNAANPCVSNPNSLVHPFRQSTVARPTCWLSPWLPGKSGGGTPSKKVSRWRLTYSALASVVGQAGIYMTLESPLPWWTLSTAWIAGFVRYAFFMQERWRKGG